MSKVEYPVIGQKFQIAGITVIAELATRELMKIHGYCDLCAGSKNDNELCQELPPCAAVDGNNIYFKEGGL